MRSKLRPVDWTGWSRSVSSVASQALLSPSEKISAPIGHVAVDRDRRLGEQPVLVAARAVGGEVEIEGQAEVPAGDVGTCDHDGKRPGRRVLEQPVDGCRRGVVADGVVVVHDHGVSAVHHVRERIVARVEVGRDDLDHRAAAVKQLDPDRPDSELTGVERIVGVGVVVHRAGDRIGGATTGTNGQIAEVEIVVAGEISDAIRPDDFTGGSHRPWQVALPSASRGVRTGLGTWFTTICDRTPVPGASTGLLVAHYAVRRSIEGEHVDSQRWCDRR